MDTFRLGYYFHHEDFPHSGVYDKLDVYLAPRNSDWMFPTRSAIFWVVEGSRSDLHKIRHPWPGGSHLQVGFGRFDLKAWNDNSISGICFGGTLIIEDKGQFTQAHLDSPAPLLREDPEAEGITPIPLLADEIEGHLARLRSQLHLEESEMIARLSHHDPLDLYAVSMSTLEAGLQALPANLQHTERANQLRHALDRATEPLQDCDCWPPRFKSLEELLK
jgi:hypothetical protein